MNVNVASSPLASAASDGCYDASRAAALSGVPKSTVYWWARNNVVVPSVSPAREKLWSYSDLMALRIVSWLRHPKTTGASELLPPSPMPQVRQALAALDRADIDLWEASHPSPLLVDRAGRIFVRFPDGTTDLRGQRTVPPEHALDLIAPFRELGGEGPDLLRPRPHLRIVPTKVAGEPHVAHSRLTTRTLAALASKGFDVDPIARMYGVAPAAVRESIDLEHQLTPESAAA